MFTHLLEEEKGWLEEGTDVLVLEFEIVVSHFPLDRHPYPTGPTLERIFSTQTHVTTLGQITLAIGPS